MIVRNIRVRGTTLAHVRQHFERWLNTRQPSSPSPQPLWALAVEIARERGVNQAARTLRLNHTALKKRLQAAGGRSRSQPPSATFVELGVGSGQVSGPGDDMKCDVVATRAKTTGPHSVIARSKMRQVKNISR